jgi:predicted nucleotidyltransferase
MSTEDLKHLLAELKQGLSKIYGQQLTALLLYGSYARGEQDAESDLDILIILDDYELYSREIKRTSVLISTLSLKYGISISRKILRQKTWLTGDTPLLRNARSEAIGT